MGINQDKEELRHGRPLLPKDITTPQQGNADREIQNGYADQKGVVVVCQSGQSRPDKDHNHQGRKESWPEELPDSRAIQGGDSIQIPLAAFAEKIPCLQIAKERPHNDRQPRPALSWSQCICLNEQAATL